MGVNARVEVAESRVAPTTTVATRIDSFIVDSSFSCNGDTCSADR